MKRTPERANSFRTWSTTSTTGPHVLLVQKAGVANVTTNGAWLRRLAATEGRSRSRSGGTFVVSFRTGALPSVGVSDAGARDPSAGEWAFAWTMKSPTP